MCRFDPGVQPRCLAASAAEFYVGVLEGRNEWARERGRERGKGMDGERSGGDGGV